MKKLHLIVFETSDTPAAVSVDQSTWETIPTSHLCDSFNLHDVKVFFRHDKQITPGNAYQAAKDYTEAWFNAGCPTLAAQRRSVQALSQIQS